MSPQSNTLGDMDGTRQCRGCNAAFPAPNWEVSTRPKIYCTDVCRARTLRLAGHPSYQRKLGPRRAISYADCSECGQLFVVRRAARATDAGTYKVCYHQPCLTARREKRNREWASQNAPTPKAHRRGLKPATCHECGTDFKGRTGAKFCSRFCCQANTRTKYAGTKDKPSKRRAERQRLAEVEPVNRNYIFERDNWRCHLCNTKIDPALKFPHPMSASIDHLIPLAQHGTHEPANVASAHLRCNIRKSDKLHQPQQLALIG